MTIEERLDKIETLLVVLVERQTVKDWYEVEEFARIVGKAPFTCREWARLGRIHASKKQSGRVQFRPGRLVTRSCFVIKKRGCCLRGDSWKGESPPRRRAFSCAQPNTVLIAACSTLGIRCR